MIRRVLALMIDLLAIAFICGLLAADLINPPTTRRTDGNR